MTVKKKKKSLKEVITIPSLFSYPRASLLHQLVASNLASADKVTFNGMSEIHDNLKL